MPGSVESMSRLASLLVSLSLITVLACGGASPPPAAEPVAAPVTESAVAAPAEPAVSVAGADDRPVPSATRQPRRYSAGADEPITELTPDAVLARIMNLYMRGLKACHRLSLERSPQNKGKVALRFSVVSSGRVTDATVAGWDPELDRCIEGEIVAWTFPHSVKAAKPHTFQIKLALQPE
jgi:hypothetical protein